MLTGRQLLNNESGVTLIETLVTALVTVAAFLSLYIGILYSEKQIERDYHDRTAALIASGAIEQQRYIYKTNKMFDGAFPAQVVVIDQGYNNKGQIIGYLTREMSFPTENFEGLPRSYTTMEMHVTWREPKDVKQREMIVREDFFPLPE